MTLGFQTELQVERISKNSWKLLRELVYITGSRYKNEVIRVPEGFRTDFASTPRFLWWIFPPKGRYSEAAVLHDYLCVSIFHGSLAKADYLFWEAMGTLKVNPVTRWLFYYFVKLKHRIA